MSAHQDIAVEVLDCDREAEREIVARFPYIMGRPGEKGKIAAAHRIAATQSLREQRDELLEALDIAMWWIKGWGAGFLFVDEWPADEAKINAAIAKATK